MFFLEFWKNCNAQPYLPQPYVVLPLFASQNIEQPIHKVRALPFHENYKFSLISHALVGKIIRLDEATGDVKLQRNWQKFIAQKRLKRHKRGK